MKTESISNRRYELDWLRVLAILVVFLYHSTRFFNLGDWHVKNVNTYVWVEFWNIFATRWMMPLFFIISGASLFYAIGKSAQWRKFYVDKFLRLMIPLIIGSVTTPPCKFTWREHRMANSLDHSFHFCPSISKAFIWTSLCREISHSTGCTSGICSFYFFTV